MTKATRKSQPSVISRRRALKWTLLTGPASLLPVAPSRAYAQVLAASSVYETGEELLKSLSISPADSLMQYELLVSDIVAAVYRVGRRSVTASWKTLSATLDRLQELIARLITLLPALKPTASGNSQAQTVHNLAEASRLQIALLAGGVRSGWGATGTLASSTATFLSGFAALEATTCAMQATADAPAPVDAQVTLTGEALKVLRDIVALVQGPLREQQAAFASTLDAYYSAMDAVASAAQALRVGMADLRNAIAAKEYPVLNNAPNKRETAVSFESLERDVESFRKEVAEILKNNSGSDVDSVQELLVGLMRGLEGIQTWYKQYRANVSDAAPAEIKTGAIKVEKSDPAAMRILSTVGPTTGPASCDVASVQGALISLPEIARLVNHHCMPPAYRNPNHKKPFARTPNEMRLVATLLIPALLTTDPPRQTIIRNLIVSLHVCHDAQGARDPRVVKLAEALSQLRLF